MASCRSSSLLLLCCHTSLSTASLWKVGKFTLLVFCFNTLTPTAFHEVESNLICTTTINSHTWLQNYWKNVHLMDMPLTSGQVCLLNMCYFSYLYKMSLIFFHVCVSSAGTILLFMLTGKRLQNPPLVDRAFDNVDLSVS